MGTLLRRTAAAWLVSMAPAIAGAQVAGPLPLLAEFRPDDFRLPALVRVARLADLETATHPLLLLGRETPAGTVSGPPTLADLGGGVSAADAVRAENDASRLLPTGGALALRVDLGLLDDLAQLPSLDETLGLDAVLDLADELGLGGALGDLGADQFLDLVEDPLPIEVTLPGLLQP